MTRGLSRGRGDAIDATSFSRTRRDAPDAARNGSNSKKRPPTTSSDGYDPRRRRVDGIRFNFHTVLYICLLEVRLDVVAEVSVVFYGQRSAINTAGEEEDAQQE